MRVVGRPRTLQLVFVLASVILVGCSPGPAMAPVEGVVTLNGKPMEDIRVTFQPTAAGNNVETGVGSTGVTDVNGRFILRRVDNDASGAVVASHKVTFSDMRAEEATKDVDAGPEPKAIPQRLPPKYATESLLFEVKSGQKNEPKFELELK